MLNSNYRPSPNSDEDRGRMALFSPPIPLHMFVKCFFILTLKSLILKKNGYISQFPWYFMEKNLRHIVRIVSILASEMVACE